MLGNHDEMERQKHQSRGRELTQLKEIAHDRREPLAARAAAIHTLCQPNTSVEERLATLDPLLVEEDVMCALAIRLCDSSLCHDLRLVQRLRDLGRTSDLELRSLALKVLGREGEASIVVACDEVLENGTELQIARVLGALGACSAPEAANVLLHYWNRCAHERLKALAAVNVVKAGDHSVVAWLASQLGCYDNDLDLLISVMLSAIRNEAGLLHLMQYLGKSSAESKTLLLAMCHAYLSDQLSFDSDWEMHLADWVNDQLGQGPSPGSGLVFGFHEESEEEGD